MARDNFTKSVGRTLAERVGYQCSNPSCNKPTVGPMLNSGGSISVGVACHISAASPGGPRFDSAVSPSVRSSIDNGIWLCAICSRLIDSDESKYTVDVITGWKVAAEAKATRDLAGMPRNEFFAQPASARHMPIPRIANLSYNDARELLRSAGWQPRMNHWTHANNDDMRYGNGLYFWTKGYHEIRHASGTGLALCSFEFRDVYGNGLIVISAGEVIEEMNATAVVWRWYFENADVD